MNRTTLIVIGAVIAAVMLYFLIDTHADVHELTALVEELLARSELEFREIPSQ